MRQHSQENLVLTEDEKYFTCFTLDDNASSTYEDPVDLETTLNHQRPYPSSPMPYVVILFRKTTVLFPTG
jgi:hypothetical protein